jgi:hypothetical protein
MQAPRRFALGLAPWRALDSLGCRIVNRLRALRPPPLIGLILFFGALTGLLLGLGPFEGLVSRLGSADAVGIGSDLEPAFRGETTGRSASFSLSSAPCLAGRSVLSLASAGLLVSTSRVSGSPYSVLLYCSLRFEDYVGSAPRRSPPLASSTRPQERMPPPPSARPIPTYQVLPGEH